jgi:proteic killer suppression protein
MAAGGHMIWHRSGGRGVAKFPGHRFEKLKGARSDTYSVRINDQWRVCFKWPAGSSGPVDVTVEDYH